MSYRAAICDDSTTDANLWGAFCTSGPQSVALRWRVSALPRLDAFLFRYAEDKSFDLLLLDVESRARTV